jgi:hypothetical protein
MFTVTLSRWQIAVFLYLVMVAVILAIRPALMFDMEQNPKAWGLDMERGVSVFSPMFVFPILALICYYIAALIELAFY